MFLPCRGRSPWSNAAMDGNELLRVNRPSWDREGQRQTEEGGTSTRGRSEQRQTVS